MTNDRHSNIRSSVLGLLLMTLLAGCELPGQAAPPENSGDLNVDRGASALLVGTSRSSYAFNVDRSGFLPVSKGEFVLPTDGQALFNQNILLVPLFGQATDKYLYTKYAGQLKDPTGYFGTLDPQKVKSPFDVPSIDYTVEPLDEVELDYYVIDGQVALEEFQKRVGLVTDSSDSQKLSYFPQLTNVPALTVTDNEVILICLLKQRVFQITRKSDIYSEDFTTRKQGLDEQSAAAFYDDYGDTTCSSMDLGGYVFLRQNYNYKNSPYTFAEIRTALVEYAASFFNVTGLTPVSEKTTKVMQSIQETLPYHLANSGAGITLPLLPTDSEFPGVLADFTAKMKIGGNLWTTDLTYAKY